MWQLPKGGWQALPPWVAESADLLLPWEIGHIDFNLPKMKNKNLHLPTPAVCQAITQNTGVISLI